MLKLIFFLYFSFACGPAFAGDLRVNGQADVKSLPSVCLGMSVIPAGVFLMGTPPGKGGKDEHPGHSVRLDMFYLDKCEVTAAQYKEFAKAALLNMPNQPAWSGNSFPVVAVDWFEARAYCEWARKRLPTEAEWEKAARGGTKSEYSFGDDRLKLGEYAWYNENSDNQGHPVGRKKPNRYGLYDMHGNVAEWVSDWYDAGYYVKSPPKNPKGPDSGTVHVIRGGAWYYYAWYFSLNLRVADRYWDYPARRSGGVGLRCAR